MQAKRKSSAYSLYILMVSGNINSKQTNKTFTWVHFDILIHYRKQFLKSMGLWIQLSGRKLTKHLQGPVFKTQNHTHTQTCTHNHLHIVKDHNHKISSD